MTYVIKKPALVLTEQEMGILGEGLRALVKEQSEEKNEAGANETIALAERILQRLNGVPDLSTYVISIVYPN